jgi:hypothetical protein
LQGAFVLEAVPHPLRFSFSRKGCAPFAPAVFWRGALDFVLLIFALAEPDRFSQAIGTTQDPPFAGTAQRTGHPVSALPGELQKWYLATDACCPEQRRNRKAGPPAPKLI